MHHTPIARPLFGRLFLWALAGLAMAPAAQALPSINLTGDTYNNVASSSAGAMTTSMGTVIFARDATQPVGTGVFDPFLRLDVKGNSTDEQGYNTSGVICVKCTGNNYTTRNVLDDMTPVNYTHDVLISDLQLTSDGKYYVFKLDINEPGTDGKSLLSLDGLKLYSTSQTAQTGEALDANNNIVDGAGGIVGTKLWDMDLGQDRSVLLDYGLNNGGSGVADMVMYVDRKVIDDQKAAGENYLVLWSRFGLQQAADTASSTADAGFEEWSYAKSSSTVPPPPPPPGVPLPGTLVLAALGLAAVRNTRSTRA